MAKGARRVRQKKIMRDAVPDASRYHVKDFPGYAAVYPEVEVIQPKYSRPMYQQRIQLLKIFVYIYVSYAEQHLIQKMI